MTLFLLAQAITQLNSKAGVRPLERSGNPWIIDIAVEIHLQVKSLVYCVGNSRLKLYTQVTGCYRGAFFYTTLNRSGIS
jgi:hypothetical protein